MGRPDTDTWGEDLLKCGMYYNRALINGDSTGLGIASLNVLLRHNYANIFIPEEDPDKIDATEGPRYWYRFTTASRRMLFDELLIAIRGNREGSRVYWAGVVSVLSNDIIEEEKTWVKDEKGRPDHMAGCFDDCLTALALAVWAHRHSSCSIGGLRFSSAAMRNGSYEGSIDLDEDLTDGDGSRYFRGIRSK